MGDQKELYYTGEPNTEKATEDWPAELDYGVAPKPWSVKANGIYDAKNRLIFIPKLVGNNRGFVSSNYENMDAVVRHVNGDMGATPEVGASLQQLQSDVVSWANEIFPHRTPQQGFLKLFEEIGEVLQEPRNKYEWADVFIMLLDIADRYNISGDDLVNAIQEKMDINRDRRWSENEIGVMKHDDTLEFKATKPTPLTIPVYFVGGYYDGIYLDHDITQQSNLLEPPEEISTTSDGGVVFIYKRHNVGKVDGHIVYKIDRVVE
jgi:NTP pyrophosphatase (non-canonical NTP hydrolase)